MQNPIGNALEQATLFQKLWMDSATKMTGVWAQFSPTSPPIDEARKLRSGMLKVFGESCEEFMRTPQFMEAMKTSLNAALDLRRMARSGMDQIHDVFETTDKEDLDGVLLAIRHVERRILDRLESVDERVENLDERMERINSQIRKSERTQSHAEEAPNAPARRRTPAKNKKTATGQAQRSASSRSKRTTGTTVNKYKK